MDERLKRLMELRAETAAQVVTLTEERKAITDKVAAETRADLDEDETVAYRAKTGEIRDAQDKIDEHDAEIKDLNTEIERSGRQSEAAAHVARATAHVTEVTEPLTYQQGDGKSYFRDLARLSVGMGDAPTMERLQRHALDVSANAEIRKLAKVGDEFRNLDRNDGTGGYAVPPLWVMNQFIELARSGRPYANLAPNYPLPGGTDSINVPKILTGTRTSIQTADNAAIDELDLTDGSVQANVKTIAGQQGLAIQLIDQSPVNFDQMVFQDLAADYATKLDLQVIQGSNASGQVKGVRSASGIQTITATSGSDNVGLLFAKIADAIQRVYTLRFATPTVIVMHPRRWAFFLAARDTAGRPLVVPSGPSQNQIAVLGQLAAEGVVGQMHGLPVAVDPNLPTTLGAGTNEDVIHVLRATDLALYESSVRTRALQETRATTLTVLLQVYGYLAFTAERQPKSIVEIGGTALTTPTFA